MTIIKTIAAKSEADVKDASFTLSVQWEHLMPSIEKAILLRSDEVIDGLIITKDSIEVKVSRKKGRKTSKDEVVEMFSQNGGGIV